MTAREKAIFDGWNHFCDCINFKASSFDAKAIKFMNEFGNHIKSFREETKKEMIQDIENEFDTLHMPCGCSEWCSHWEDFKKKHLGGGK